MASRAWNRFTMTSAGPRHADLHADSRRMRVAVVATMPPNTYSGGRYYALMLAEALAQGGHDVHFVTNQMPVFFPDMERYPRHAEISVALTKDFRSGLPEGDFDFVVLIPAASFAGYYARVEMFAIRRGAHLVFVNFESGDWFNSLSPVPRPLSEWAPWKRAVEGASLVLSISAEGNAWAKKFYQKHPARTRFEFCYPPVNTPAADSTGAIEHERRILLFMRFSTARHKGSESIDKLFCEAMRGHTLVFVLGKESVPPETLMQLTALSRDFGVDLEFKPQLSDVDKFREIKRARLVLFPSLFEGYGYPPVEALYCGTPCVAFRLPVLEETCGETMFYAPHGDWQVFRQEIEAALSAPIDSDVLNEQVREIALLETATRTLERMFGQILAEGPVDSSERARRLAHHTFQERWRLNDFRLRLRTRRHRMRRRTVELVTRQAKRIRALRKKVNRAISAAGRKVNRPGTRRGKRNRGLEFLARRIERLRPRGKSRGRVSYYPAFDTNADLTNHWYRAKWYLPSVPGICREVFFPVRAGVSVGTRPEYMCDAPAEKDHLRLRAGPLAALRGALRSDLILVWKKGFTSSLLSSLASLRGIPIVNVATDDLDFREYGAYCSLVWKHLTPALDRSLVLAEHRQRFVELAARLKARGFTRSCVFGTGPSLEAAMDFDYGNSLNIVCNSIVQNSELLDYLRPHFICAGDVVSHLGVSAYADRFRADLIRALRERDVAFLTTADFGALFLHHHPELEEKVFLIEQTTHEPNFDFTLHYGAPRLDSTLNIHMLPLAATFADEIWLLGCDGKSEVRNNEDFWAHAKQAQYHDLVETGHLCHPTFDVHRQASTYDRFIASTAKTIEAGEQLRGIRYGALVPSNIPALKSRSIQPCELAAAGLTRPYPLDGLIEHLPRPETLRDPVPVNGRESLPLKTAISRCAFYRRNVLEVTGWALSQRRANRVEIWLGEEFLGVANLRMIRKDIAAKYPEYDEMDSGFQFYGRTSRAGSARVSVRVRIYSGDRLEHQVELFPKDD